jgi:hypothetical protein
MRHECEIEGCHEPAVDYLQKPTEDSELDGVRTGDHFVRFYLCAKHWDEFTRIPKIMLR